MIYLLLFPYPSKTNSGCAAAFCCFVLGIQDGLSGRSAGVSCELVQGKTGDEPLGGTGITAENYPVNGGNGITLFCSSSRRITTPSSLIPGTT